MPVAQNAHASAQPTCEETHTEKRPGFSSGMRTVSISAPPGRRKLNFTKGSTALARRSATSMPGTVPTARAASSAARRMVAGDRSGKRAAAVHERHDPPRVGEIDVGARRQKLGGNGLKRETHTYRLAYRTFWIYRRGVVPRSRETPRLSSSARALADGAADSAEPAIARRALAAGALALVTLAAPISADASPQDVFGYGPRSTAMAGAGASIGWGFETVRANPALLTLSRERSLSVGWLGAYFDVNANGPLSSEPMSGTIIGGTLPLPFEGFLKDRIAIGLGFFTPFELVARARLLYPEKPKFPIVDRIHSVAVQMGIGIDIGHGVRIGGGFSALAGLTGSVIVATDASGRVGTVVEDTLVAAYGPIVGASYERGPYRVGLTYRGELAGPFDVVIQVKDLGSIVVPPLNISGLAQYDPHQAELEVSRSLGPLRVALGATYRHWSAYPGAVAQTVRCPLAEPSGTGPGAL